MAQKVISIERCTIFGGLFNPACIGVVVKSYPKANGNAKFYLHEAQILKTNTADLSSMTAPQLSVDTVDKSASNNIISEDTENTTPSYSINEDSQGRKLSDEQIEFFIESKVRDELNDAPFLAGYST